MQTVICASGKSDKSKVDEFSWKMSLQTFYSPRRINAIHIYELSTTFASHLNDELETEHSNRLTMKILTFIAAVSRLNSVYAHSRKTNSQIQQKVAE